ncbi:uracil-DNA glycosylase [Fuerstiella marisgermanici]|uniref:Type-4 uracil-DNA glycosylase n=1 Tax=Fuerstiella marisgermanici TaxID=1891926 RepID=A0A1P8WQH2_9PLAN|nr:uracil-DNA glycosylase [Fuerstiella marisgermanici]APZ96308.1 uracil-DNA glycosylase, family 4 [Fuerstiella marisgermanici]
MAGSRNIRQFLQLLKSSGVSYLPTVVLPEVTARPRMGQKKAANPRNPVTALADATKAKTAAKLPTSADLRPGSATAPPPLEATKAVLAEVMETAEQKQDGLLKLADIVASCQRCEKLADSRRQTVFGVGNPDAEIMFIGEAPGADEDRQGEPFVGAAGQLLNKIIEACGLRRDEIYICNILRCRPPGNRNPLPQEVANCREFLDGQIKIVNPTHIVCWGTVAAQNLLQVTESVGRLRGQFLQHGDARVLCTYHPSYLLRNPSAKKQVWDDMKLFMKDRGVDLG